MVTLLDGVLLPLSAGADEMSWLEHAAKEIVSIIANTEIYFFISYLLFLRIVRIINKTAIIAAANPTAKVICETSIPNAP